MMSSTILAVQVAEHMILYPDLSLVMQLIINIINSSNNNNNNNNDRNNNNNNNNLNDNSMITVNAPAPMNVNVAVGRSVQEVDRTLINE